MITALASFGYSQAETIKIIKELTGLWMQEVEELYSDYLSIQQRFRDMIAVADMEEAEKAEEEYLRHSIINMDRKGYSRTETIEKLFEVVDVERDKIASVYDKTILK